MTYLCTLSLIHDGPVRCFALQAAGDSDDEEDKAPVVAPEPPGTEEEMKERKLLADIDAAVQKEAARQRRLKKTVSTRVWVGRGRDGVEWCSGERGGGAPRAPWAGTYPRQCSPHCSTCVFVCT